MSCITCYRAMRRSSYLPKGATWSQAMQSGRGKIGEGKDLFEEGLGGEGKDLFEEGLDGK